MELVSGSTFWTAINNVPHKYTYLSNDMDYDVVVIGGGVTGAICAYHFIEAGINTMLVDKNIIGYGSTSASTSILQYEIDTDLIGLKGLIGIDNAVKSFKLCEKAVYDIEKIICSLEDKCGFTLRDCFYYTPTESDAAILKKEFDLRKQYGFDVEFIDENSSKNMFSFPVKAGIYSRRGAGQIDPYRFTHNLISSSVKKGLKVFENTEIIDVNTDEKFVTLTTRNKFKIKAKKVIIAQGFNSRRYIDKKTAILTRSFTIVTKPIENFNGWHNKCIIRDTNDAYTYLRSTDDNRIIIGGEDMDVGGDNSRISKPPTNDSLSQAKFDILSERLKTLFPLIPDIEIEYKFSGLFGETKDGLPYIGEYEGMPNCYFCLGFGSNGILYGILGAQLLRDLHLGNYSSELELFKFNR